jgi:hypothetical protein
MAYTRYMNAATLRTKESSAMLHLHPVAERHETKHGAERHQAEHDHSQGKHVGLTFRAEMANRM